MINFPDDALADYRLPIANVAADPGCRMCITIPAKDEAEWILDCLTALRQQIDNAHQPLDPSLYEVILLANNCNDLTADIARTFAKDYPSLRLHVVERYFPADLACVGTARRLMMDAAASRLPDQGIICTTDADTRVDRKWVQSTLDAFDQGARAVGGRIVVPSTARTAYRKMHLQDVTYRSLQALLESIVDPDGTDPWPRHFQNFGPSTAVRVDAYLACGGMPPIRCVEDVALAKALERIDVTIVHDPAVKVYTSDRRSERVDGVAFSHQLDKWADMLCAKQQPTVIGLQNCLRLFKWKVALRKAFLRGRIGGTPALISLAAHLRIIPCELNRRVAEAPTFGALYQTVRTQVETSPGFADATIDQAIRDLRGFTQSVRNATPCVSTRRAGSDPYGPPADDGSRLAYA